MPRDRFEAISKKRILEHMQDAGYDDIEIDDIVTVWYCYMLGNRKGLFAIPDLECYFETTHHKDRNAFYLDCYEKTENWTICLEA